MRVGGWWWWWHLLRSLRRAELSSLVRLPLANLSISLPQRQELLWRLYGSAAASTALCKTLTGRFNIPSSVAAALLTLHIFDNR